jgi:hypothetical protein
MRVLPVYDEYRPLFKPPLTLRLRVRTPDYPTVNWGASSLRLHLLTVLTFIRAYKTTNKNTMLRNIG